MDSGWLENQHVINSRYPNVYNINTVANILEDEFYSDCNEMYNFSAVAALKKETTDSSAL